ncbi:MAG TPA: hypothetical protein DCM08_14500 [Microscillaceae bacterium]|jgi:uncharacterized protein (DUF2141 family)|nr:hypothetical protein [Microscillaceae bacterium]
MMLAHTPQTTTWLKVSFSNLKTEKGQIYFALYKTKASFMQIEQAALAEVFSLADAQKGIYVSVTPGQTYAFTIFHDENGNGELDKNGLGIPKEGYAFSNNATGAFGPPSFDKAGFQCSMDCEQTIKLNY